MITYNDIKNNDAINIYIKKADDTLGELGFTEHSFAHVTKVANVAADILSNLEYSEHEIELAKIASHMHDIGNVISRDEHAQSSAIMAFRLLDRLGMPPEDIASIITAIGNHDESNGLPLSPISAALILADKTDVRRSRVRNTDFATFDIHDRVNYSVMMSNLEISAEEKTITLILEIDTNVSAVSDYFEIFLKRMLMCKKAAEKLGTKFGLNINGQRLM